MGLGHSGTSNAMPTINASAWTFRTSLFTTDHLSSLGQRMATERTVHNDVPTCQMDLEVECTACVVLVRDTAKWIGRKVDGRCARMPGTVSSPAVTIIGTTRLGGTFPNSAGPNRKGLCTVRVFRQKFTLEDAIGSHACSLEANMRVANGIPLGSSLSYQLTL
jgi:hypothetical protein